jgi:photosystem II stability/assembly factor-like uncharacterized protein
MKPGLLVLLGMLVATTAGRPAAHDAPPASVVTEQHSGTTARLQAVSAVNERVVWVSGVRATWARTVDGGATWVADSMADSWLEFRDVHAVSADRAWLLAAGPGDSSRIYHTEDGGRHWTLQFQNRDSSAFYDAFDFWDAERGIVVSDAARGHMVVRTTDDGGATWKLTPPEGMPPALPGEGAPAASGTCIVTRPGGRAWFSTEAGESGGRVYASADYGRTWRVAPTPIVRGKDSGVASVAMRDDARGFALGGRLLVNSDTSVAVAVTADGGRSWAAAVRPPFTGPVYGSALWGGPDELLVSGPGGVALARLSDRSPAWSLLSSDNCWAVDAKGKVAWAVGPVGRIIRIDARHHP